MKWRVWWGKMRVTVTDLPLELIARTKVTLTNLPVLQCEGCAEYLVAGDVFAKVETILSGAGHSAELEIIPFAGQAAKVRQNAAGSPGGLEFGCTATT